jgi:FMN-dependent NADH-azoreductase
VSTLFRLDASIRRDGSHTRALADEVERAATAESTTATVLRRDVGLHRLSPDAWPDCTEAAMIPAEDRTVAQREAVHLASTLADELEQSDAYVFATPLYNWGVSQHFKTWFDIVVTDPRFSPRSSTIAGRPAVLVTARGGDYRVGAPRAEWDHASGWMRRVLEDLWGLELAVVEVNMTLAPVREYMAHLREEADADVARARVDARSTGADLARGLVEAV